MAARTSLGQNPASHPDPMGTCQEVAQRELRFDFSACAAFSKFREVFGDLDQDSVAFFVLIV